jgi:hypothetical protein
VERDEKCGIASTHGVGEYSAGKIWTPWGPKRPMGPISPKPQGASEAAPQTGRDMRILNAAIIGGGMIEDYYAQCERELQRVPNLNDASLFVTW